MAGVAPQRPGFGPQNVHTTATTEVEMDNFRFLWTIKNYSALSSRPFIWSPKFRGGILTNHLWQLRIAPKTTNDFNMEFFGVHLKLNEFGTGESKPGRSVVCRFKISLLNDQGRPGKQAGSKEMHPLLFALDSMWGFDKFIPSYDVTAPCRKLVNDDSLKVLVEIWIEGNAKHHVCQGGAVKRGLDPDEKARRLAAAYNRIFRESEMKDFTVQTSKREIHVHKSVLAEWSPVFSAMIQNDMEESKTSKVMINEFDDEVVDGMLQYFYTGTADMMIENATELIKIAEKYGVAGLKEECELLVAENMTVDNAAELLYLADTFNASTLLERVMGFMKFYKEQVMETDTFKLVAKEHPIVFKNFYIF